MENNQFVTKKDVIKIVNDILNKRNKIKSKKIVKVLSKVAKDTNDGQNL